MRWRLPDLPPGVSYTYHVRASLTAWGWASEPPECGGDRVAAVGFSSPEDAARSAWAEYERTGRIVA